jgi:hypothetical protein
MNATQNMKIVAWIQLVIALISTLVFIIPSLSLFLAMIGIWWLGIRLLIGYYNISQGKRSIRETRRFWKGSLAFNVIGIVVGIAFINRYDPFRDILYFLPGIAGIILAIIALLIPAEKLQTLEYQHSMNP